MISRKGSATIANLLDSVERTRPWDARTASPIVTMVGSVELDFRQATLGAGETEVVVANLLGSVEIVLPEGLPVSVTGLTLIGKRRVLDETSNGFGHGADDASEELAAGGGQRLRLAVFSGVGSIDTVRSAAPVGVTPEPSRVL